jgi:hypothetical protein
VNSTANRKLILEVVMVTRISIGYFEPHQADEVAAMLEHSAESLVPAIKKLAGLRHYYVGLDPQKGAMTNTSVWDSLPEAMQMANLPEMLALRDQFEALGLRFIEITNHDVLWEI